MHLLHNFWMIEKPKTEINLPKIFCSFVNLNCPQFEHQTFGLVLNNKCTLPLTLNLVNTSLKYDNLQTRSHLIIDECPKSNSDVPELPDTYKNLLRHFISGGLAGAISRSVVAPLDVIKVHLQINREQEEEKQKPTKNRRIDQLANFKQFAFNSEYRRQLFDYYLNRKIISNLVLLRQIYYKLFNENGLLSFWKGNGINTLKVVPEKACRFMFYEMGKNMIASHSHSDDHLTFNQRLMAGSFAGFSTQTIIYPLEFVKTRLIVANLDQHRGIFNMILQIYRNQGITAFYRGYMPSVIGTVPSVSINLAVYETIKNYCLDQGIERNKFKKSIYISSSVISCFISAFVTYPMFLVRTKMQIQEQNVSVKTVVRSVMHKYGFSGFYRGFTINFVKSVPSITITYMFYEYMREKLGAQSEI